MWIDHCFFGRPLTAVRAPEVEWTDDENLLVTVSTTGKAEVRSVSVHHVHTNEEKFFASGFTSKFEGIDHKTQPIWKELVVERTGEGQYTARIPVPGEKGDRVALFVKVDDFAGNTTGHAASFVQWLQAER